MPEFREPLGLRHLGGWTAVERIMAEAQRQHFLDLAQPELAGEGLVRRGTIRTAHDCTATGTSPNTDSASKSAELSLSRGYAEHYASRGVLVNAANPGPLAGEMWLDPGGLLDQSAAASGQTREQVLERMSAALPLGRLGTTREVAEVIGFL